MCLFTSGFVDAFLEVSTFDGYGIDIIKIYAHNTCYNTYNYNRCIILYVFC